MAVRVNADVSRHAVKMAQDSVTRPANATQYAVGDALSDNATTPTAAGYFTLPLVRRKGGGGKIISATLHKSDDDVTTAAFDVLLFDTVPALAGFEDNAAIAITDAEMKTCQGVLRFTAAGWARHGTGDTQTVTPESPIGFVCVSTEMNLYGITALQGTYTPASAEVFTLTAFSVPD